MCWLLLAVVLLLLGHIIKVYRWQLFIRLYEKPSLVVLMKSLSIAQAINFIVPYHLGDLYRIWYSGKKMSNGIKFSFATVIIEHYIDLLVLAFMCAILFIMGHNTMGSMILFATIAATIVVLTILSIKWENMTKAVVIKFAKIFNSALEFKILGLTWAFVLTFKCLIHEISKAKVALSTILMWLLYVSSYWCLAETFQSSGYYIRLRDVVDVIFNQTSFACLNISLSLLLIYGIYVLTPLVIILFVGYIYNKVHKEVSDISDKQLSIIPHVNSKDALVFLETFFSGDIEGYQKGFLSVNKDVTVLQDFTSSSKCLTYLCTDGKKMFYRKFAIGDAKSFLSSQVDWICQHSDDLPLPIILNKQIKENYCSYDMAYTPSYIPFFTYVHSHSLDNSWRVLNSLLTTLDSNLYKYDNRVNEKDILSFIDQTVNNFQEVKHIQYLKGILSYKKIHINGREYLNLNFLEEYLTSDYLFDLFKRSPVCEIHGNLTLDSIVCNENDYYIIDPNVNRTILCPWIDLGTLLLSLHGGYEFLIRVTNATIKDDRIEFTYVRSSAYDALYAKFCQHILDYFGPDVLKQAYYHEIILWLNLIIEDQYYKGEKSLVFYAGLIMALNDIVKE